MQRITDSDNPSDLSINRRRQEIAERYPYARDQLPTLVQLEALARVFEMAKGNSGGQTRLRKLLFAWHNARNLGGFDLADLWSFDASWLRDALTVIGMIATSPNGWYAEHYGYEKEMEALIEIYGPRGQLKSERCARCDLNVQHHCDHDGYQQQLLEERRESERYK